MSATWKTKCWDLLLDLDCAPRPVPGGYACALRKTGLSLLDDGEAGVSGVFATPRALRQTHLFDPLQCWMERELAPATHLCLMRWGGKNGSTAATLETPAGLHGPEPAPGMWPKHVKLKKG